jgi:imidazolonepropionase
MELNTSFLKICYLREEILRLNTHMGLLITNIKGLIKSEDNKLLKVSGKEMSSLDVLSNAWLLTNKGCISDFGPMNSMSQAARSHSGKTLDASGRYVFPSFCDSHTHLVFAGSREGEFTDKIKGLSYEEIAKRGGGILNSSRLLSMTSEQDLYDSAMVRIREIISQGTGAVEIKSGYGLSLESELKMLRVIRQIKETAPIEVKSTFLGAHAVPQEFRGRKDEYVSLVINEMIPVVASLGLADFIDVFCDEGFFSTDDTDRILMAGMKYGLPAKIHANELANSGGVQVAVKYNALSADHLERSGSKEIESLKGSGTMPTLLPGCSFFLGLPDAPARRMIDSGLAVALASDYNPGTSPSGNMKFISSLGCIRLRMLPEEAINATTINGACAMGISESHGTIARGKAANMFITKPIPSYQFFPYAFGSDLIEKVILNGEIVK